MKTAEIFGELAKKAEMKDIQNKEEELWIIIKIAILGAAKEACSIIKRHSNKKQPSWWDQTRKKK